MSSHEHPIEGFSSSSRERRRASVMPSFESSRAAGRDSSRFAASAARSESDMARAHLSISATVIWQAYIAQAIFPCMHFVPKGRRMVAGAWREPRRPQPPDHRSINLSRSGGHAGTSQWCHQERGSLGSPTSAVPSGTDHPVGPSSLWAQLRAPNAMVRPLLRSHLTLPLHHLSTIGKQIGGRGKTIMFNQSLRLHGVVYLEIEVKLPYPDHSHLPQIHPDQFGFRPDKIPIWGFQVLGSTRDNVLHRHQRGFRRLPVNTSVEVTFCGQQLS